MYAIFKNKRPIKGQVNFYSYEKARQFLRRIIRKMGREAYLTTLDMSGWAHRDGCDAEYCWDGMNRNPTNYTALGYEIRKVS